MGTLHRSENLHLAEDDYGGLWLYLRGITLDTMEGDEYDFAFNLNALSHQDLIKFAHGILAHVEADFSIE